RFSSPVRFRWWPTTLAKLGASPPTRSPMGSGKADPQCLAGVQKQRTCGVDEISCCTQPEGRGEGLLTPPSPLNAITSIPTQSPSDGSWNMLLCGFPSSGSGATAGCVAGTFGFISNGNRKVGWLAGVAATTTGLGK